MRAATDVKTLDARIRYYTKDWETEVRQKLRAAKVELFTLSDDPYERAEVKTKIETLSAVLDLLQGKRKYEAPTITEQREEIAQLTMRLQDAQDRIDEVVSSLFAHKKIIKDLKGQLHADNAKLIKTERQAESMKQELYHQLQEAHVVNMDLMSKLKNAQEPLQQLNTKDIQTANKYMDACTDTEDMVIEEDRELELSSPESESPCQWFTPEFPEKSQKEEEEEAFCLKICELQGIFVSEIKEDIKAMLNSQEVHNAQLQAALNVVDKQLMATNPDSKKVKEYAVTTEG